MSRYIGTTELKQYLGIASTTDDALLQACINRAESAIDNFTRRNFVGTPGTQYLSRYEQTRVVESGLYLQQDLHTLVSLTLGDGRNVPVGSAWLEPRIGPPYRIIRLKSAYSVYVWNTDQDMIIAGTWGFGTVPPDDIVQATVRLSAQTYRQKDAAVNDTVGFEAGGVQTMPRGLPQDVYDILCKYRSRTGGAVG